MLSQEIKELNDKINNEKKLNEEKEKLNERLNEKIDENN